MCVQLMRHWQGGKDKLSFLFEQSSAQAETTSVASKKTFEVESPALQTAFQWLQELDGVIHALCSEIVSN